MIAAYRLPSTRPALWLAEDRAGNSIIERPGAVGCQTSSQSTLFRAAEGFVMAGGQMEQKADSGVARRTEGLPGIRGQVRHLVEAKNGRRWGCLSTEES